MMHVLVKALNINIFAVSKTSIFMNNFTLIRQNSLFCLYAVLMCGFSTFAFENNPASQPNCTLIQPAGATATTGNAALAIDNNVGTRWESAEADPQSLTVDLGSSQNINTVTIDWETANAKEYWLRGSIDGETWVDIVHKTNMPLNTRTDVLDGINATYRYLKMDGVTRNTGYGYSIWGFHVCGDAIAPSDCVEAPIASATATSGNASAAIDNVYDTRWESAFNDQQDFTVDLGTVVLVKEITIMWESANAKDYTLSGSVDGTDWVVIANLTNMATGAREDHFDGIDTGYRYLQMHGIARNPALDGGYYGYSIFEFNVCAPYVPLVPLTCDTPAAAASATATTGTAAAAIDGNMNTRWESAFNDTQSITIDRGEVVAIDFVKIYWEVANAKNYTLSGSVNGTDWTLIAIKSNMPTGTRTDDIVVNGSYRYFKVDCTLRNTGYGYSIWEFAICGELNYTSVPALIQAEDWYQMTGVLTEDTADTGGGKNVHNIDAGEWMKYPVSVPHTGQYTINARVAALGSGGVIEYRLDGVSLGTVNVPDTTAWQTWNTVSLTVNLTEGDHVFMVYAVSPPFNLNWIDIAANFVVWNGTAWDYGTPAAGVDAIINGAYSGNSFEVDNLTVNTGKTLTVTTAKTVTVNGQLVNNGSIDVQNNAALLQPDGSTYTGTGSFTARRDSNPLYRLDYTLWGSPVHGTQTLTQFSPYTATNPMRFYTYGLSEGVEQYIAVDAAATTVFSPGTGYLIRMPNNLPDVEGYNTGVNPLVVNGVFVGAANNGDVGVAIGNLSGHYIAVSNPYPSPISVVDFFQENQAVLQAGNGIYFWRKRNNSAESSYAHLSLAGFTANSTEGGDMGGEGGDFYYSGNDSLSTAFNSNWIISPGQGFFVKVKPDLTAGTQVMFKNSMRRSAPAANGQPFFKTQDNNDAPQVSRWWINLAGANAFSQALTTYMPQGTTGIDYGYDAKIFADGNAKLYTVAADENLAIQSRPVFTATDVVPMGYSVAAAGQFTLTLERTEGVFAQGQDIYIKDNMLGTISALGENGYSFTSAAGTFNTRFEVVYQPQGALGAHNPELASSVMVYQNNGAINIETGAVPMESVTLYDVRGRKLYALTGINGTQAAIAHLNATHQVVIVEINTVQGKVTRKIVY